MREKWKHRKKSFLFALMVMTVVLILPMQAWAYTRAGNCGDTVRWNFDKNTKVLTISGSGAMYNYGETEEKEAPWFHMAEETDDMDTRVDYGYGSIETIHVKEGVTSIGDWAFNGMYGVEEIEFSDGLLSIGDHAFANMEDLRFSKLPSSCKTIGDSAFSESPIGESLTIPSSCKTIGKYAFAGTNLQHVEIPSTVNSIGKYAFGYYAEGWDDKYELDDNTKKKDIKKFPAFYILGPASDFRTKAVFRYAKAYGLDYVMKGVKGPKIRNAKNMKTRKILLKWKKVNKASGYQIRYSRSSTFDPYATIKYINMKNNKIVVRKTAKLKKKKTYYITIRYFKKVDKKRVYSEWTTPAWKVKIKK